DVALFYTAITSLVKPGGVLVLSTLNRTAKSYALGIVGAEVVLRWLPRGTHTWSKFIKPSEMAAALRKHGFETRDMTGITFSPFNWSFALNSKDLDVNYLMVATPGK
ncbi:MAG: bifunctional 2-polyprenyl-6-hydroxyphenol methylase/3-demethylubiquinol 3-O-methyltransferase UbiG, partial [Rickettsiales bacterium]|nr:bifunctional 2-polyprenyl-6-hydroxyphenol methylase/3-demethylubiquinol 3-O-methyltransferase UbiG [Rickettsiales bacterium]